jgi:predicted nucleic acid-binding Zn ribbon protein
MNYLYKCSCGKLKEVQHSIRADPRVLCPLCRKMMRRVILGGSGYIFPMGTRKRET